MFSVECHFTEEYVEENLDMDRMFAFFKYRKECPPAGLIIKLLAESLAGKKKKSKKAQSQNNNQEDDGDEYAGNPRPDSFKNDEERIKWEEGQLSELIQIFGGNGGIVRHKKGDK